MSKSIEAKLHEVNLKIIKWTCKAEAALTREQARKALRKIAKHSLKLAKLQGRVYTQDIPEDQP